MTTNNSGDFLVPFKGRNYSGCYDQNFLWKSNNVYVMDNHRAALWCWLQHISPERSHSIFHMDRHYDTLESQMTTWMKHLPNDWGMTIDEYLTHSYEFHDGDDIPLFRFDNYLSIYLKKFGKALNSCYFATHDDGDKPKLKRKMLADLWDIPGNFEYWLSRDKTAPWIVNIDLDYFFCDDAGDSQACFASRNYIEDIFRVVRRKIGDGSIAVTTIALSPEFAGGWEQSEQVMDIAMTALGIDFRLPGA